MSVQLPEKTGREQDSGTSPGMIHLTWDDGTPAVALCGTLLFGEKQSYEVPAECIVCAEMGREFA